MPGAASWPARRRQSPALTESGRTLRTATLANPRAAPVDDCVIV